MYLTGQGRGKSTSISRCCDEGGRARLLADVVMAALNRVECFGIAHSASILLAWGLNLKPLPVECKGGLSITELHFSNVLMTY